jgi:integrase
VATLGNKQGLRYSHVRDRAGERRYVPLGRIGKGPAEEIRAHLSALESAMVSGTSPSRKASEWLASLSETFYAKLAEIGLCPSREQRDPAQLGKFLDAYIKRRKDLKPRSIRNIGQVRDSLVAFFGAKRDLTTLTRGEMKDWRIHLGDTYAQATASAHVKKARQMFNDAIERNLITDNPLRGVKAGSQSNATRTRYVSTEDVRTVISKCPDAEWRLIFAMARFAGLRTPSETQLLRWSEVDWDRGRFVVHVPKTEHHEGKGRRVVPIFPALLPYLREAFEQADEGATFVIARHRGENISTQAKRIIGAAGLTAWPKTFQNLRVSCETDLLTRYPINVVLAWIGHTERVRREHYNVAPESAYQMAAGLVGIGSASAAPRDAERSGKVRNAGGEESRNPAENDDFGGIHYPRQGSNYRGFPRQFEGIPKPVMRRALRRLRNALSSDRYRAATSQLHSRPLALPLDQKGGR